jgi:hypothetical protein
MNRILLFLAFHIMFLTSAFGQTLSDSIVLKKIAGRYGVYQNDNKLNKEQFIKTLETNPEAFKQLRSVKSTGTFRAIISGIGVGLIAAPIGLMSAGKNPNLLVAGIGVGMLVGTIPLARKADRKLKSAIKTYNNGLRKPPALDEKEMKISMTGNGVGLIVTF